MRAAAAQYHALCEAMKNNRPNCEPWPDIYTGDEPADVETLRFAADLCRTCPLLQECGNYARAARPGMGIWGGRQYPLKPDRSTVEKGITHE